MNKKIFSIILCLVSLVLLNSILINIATCQEVNSTNSTNSSDLTNLTINDTVNPDSNINTEVIIRNFIPKQFKVGDVQFNIQLMNNGDYEINNLIAVVSGRGYSTYDVFPIESLGSGEKDYIFINGNFKETGNITLTIRIRGDIFYQNVSVVSDENLDEKQKADEQRKEILLNLSNDLQDLEQKYNSLEDEISNKSDNNYDVSKVNLDDLKKILRDAQLDILTESIGEARINLNLGQQEYSDQKNSLDRASKIPLIQRTKDYAVVFSAIAGALIMFFTLSELLRRQGESVFSAVGRILRLKKREEQNNVGKKKNKKK
jgi:hypothetical protein